MAIEALTIAPGNIGKDEFRPWIDILINGLIQIQNSFLLSAKS